jgi:hypothetical protein
MSTLEFIKIERVNAALDPLLADMERCITKVMDDRNSGTIDQLWPRALIRSFFVVVEAFTHELKVMIKAAVASRAFQLSEDESGALSDVVCDLDKQGRVTTRPRFISTDRYFRFIYRLAIRMMGGSYRLPVSDARFGHFKQLLLVRNRITHPKGPLDVVVTAEEIEALFAAILWYIEAQQELVRLWQYQAADFIYEASRRE